jgi:hypothetical protein
MTDSEINEVIERLLNLYIEEIKLYYDQPRYRRPNAHTMIEHLFWVLEHTKKKFIDVE